MWIRKQFLNLYAASFICWTLISFLPSSSSMPFNWNLKHLHAGLQTAQGGPHPSRSLQASWLDSSPLYEAEKVALQKLFLSQFSIGTTELIHGWSAGTDPCGMDGSGGWYGIRCSKVGEDPEGRYTIVSFKIENTISFFGDYPFPPEVSSFRNLTSLSFSETSLFSGSLPPQYSSLTKLQNLTLSSCGMTSFPGFVKQITNLTYLDVSHNFVGDFSLEHLTRLRHLNLAGMGLRGPFPGWIQGMSQLRHLDLGGNILSGPFPGWLRNLTELTYVDFCYNDFADSARFHLPSFNWFGCEVQGYECRFSLSSAQTCPGSSPPMPPSPALLAPTNGRPPYGWGFGVIALVMIASFFAVLACFWGVSSMIRRRHRQWENLGGQREPESGATESASARSMEEREVPLPDPSVELLPVFVGGQLASLAEVEREKRPWCSKEAMPHV